MANVAHKLYSFFQRKHNHDHNDQSFSKSSDGSSSSRSISRSHSTSIAGPCTWNGQHWAMQHEKALDYAA